MLLRAGVAAIEAGDDGRRVAGVRLADGRLLPADLVLIGIGLEPRTELAGQLGLEVDNGIVVDACARTSNPAVVAAGDCTTLPHPVTGEGRLRIESVQNAIAQAKTAAASLLGQPGGDPGGALVLVRPGRPQAADRRAVPRLRPGRGARGAGQRAVLRALLRLRHS